jgi:hypothetical protein
MLAKLLALLAETKGGVVAVVLLAGATTATVAATSPDVQSSLDQLTSGLTSQSHSDCDGQGQPVVVAQRNAADKLLRDAYAKDHKALEALRGGPGKDNQAVGAVVRTYDDQLRDTLNIALNKVAGLTLGREGQVRKAEANSTANAVPTAAPVTTPTVSLATGSPTTTVPCSPTLSSSASPAAKSTETSAPGKPTVDGRVTVAERTTLNADIQAIVDAAITDMDALVTKATADVAAVPAPEHGKSGDNPGNKPENAGKPSGSPKH